MKSTLLSQSHQKGATLLVALIMLLIITILATSSMRGTTLQNRISGNTAEQKRVFNAAEAALREAEKRLLTLTQNSTVIDYSYSDCKASIADTKLYIDRVCILSNKKDLNTNKMTRAWSEAAFSSKNDIEENSVSYKGYDGNSSFISENPNQSIDVRWVITQINSPGNEIYYYRITAAAKDNAGRAPVILQSVVKVEKI